MDKMTGSTPNPPNNRSIWLEKYTRFLPCIIIFGGFIAFLLVVKHHNENTVKEYDTVYNIHLKGGTFFDNDYYTYDYHYDKGNIVFRNIHRGINMVAPKDAVISITESQWRR